MADFKSEGNIPLDRELLTMCVIIGARAGRTSWSKLVGSGSKGQEALDDFLMIEVISETVAGVKVVNLEDDGMSNDSNGGQCRVSIVFSMSARMFRMLEIFVIKNSLKIWAKELADVCTGKGDGFPRPSNLSTI